ncbi:proline-rich protein 36-like [Oreochromis niloticus]|uniref:proline-rich protein 36-like n=1 Tax=Oreochromis niloticus TaxID=8128 RepID=UPI000DF1DFC4|nr:proline-rich protein 36-like [Oreochromis niloticus]
MTRPVPRRHDWNPADSDLYERQEAALSRWAEELRGKQRLFVEREHVFEGTRLALGGPRRRCIPPPAASPAPEHLPQTVGASRRASAAPSLAAPLLANTPATHSPDLQPRHGTAATPPTSAQRRLPRQRLICLPRPLPLPGESGAHAAIIWTILINSRRKARATSDKSVTIPVYANPKPGHSSTVLSESAPSSTCQPVPVSSAQATVKNTQSPKPDSITLPVSISTSISQPTPTPVPAPRTRAAVTQYTSTPAPVSRVGVTGVQPPPVPVPAPRLRAARIQPDHPRGPAEALQPVPSCSGGSEELACLPISPPLHPPPDPAFHALALSLVRLAEVSPAQGPALLAQAVALSPSVIQSLAQPLATPTPAQPVASPTSLHPVASPAQSVPSPAVQPPAQSVPSSAVQLPLQSVYSPAVQLPLQSVHLPAVQLPLQSVHSPAVQLPLQSVHSSAVQLPLQSVNSLAVQPPAQSPVSHSPALQPAPVQSVQPAPVHLVLSSLFLFPSRPSSSLSSLSPSLLSPSLL